MTTIVRNIKIPGQAGGVKLSYEPGPKRLAEDQRLKPARSIAEMFGADAVTPSVKGRQGVTPSTMGIAAQARFAQLSKVAAVAAGGLSAIMTIRDSAEAEAYPELAALADDPKFIAVIARVIAKIGKEVDELTSGRADAQGPDHENDEEVLAAAREKERTGRDPHVAAGRDSGRPILGAEDMARVEQARAKLSRLRTAESIGDPGDIVRAQFGMEPRAVEADELYSMFEGKRSK